MKQFSLKISIIFLVVIFSLAWIDPFRDRVSKGNSEFHEKKFDEAKKSYKEAENFVPGEKDKKKLAFNKADADLMLGDYDSAVSNFEKSMQSEDKEVQKKAFFNLGNAYLAKKNYQEAVKAYINALKIDPKYEKAKKNIEYILKKKKMDEDKNRGGDGKGGGDNDDKRGQDQNRDAQNKENRGGDERQKSAGSMSKEQIKNILESMKKMPVRRAKGGSDRKYLDKDW